MGREQFGEQRANRGRSWAYVWLALFGTDGDGLFGTDGDGTKKSNGDE